MYIEGKYWNHYIGDTDDSLTLAAYLTDKGKREISLAEIFSDIGLDKLKGDFLCVDLRELAGDDLEEEVSHICITATPEEHSLINKVLGDFVSDPLSYDLIDMCPEEDMMETAEVCGRLREELYG